MKSSLFQQKHNSVMNINVIYNLTNIFCQRWDNTVMHQCIAIHNVSMCVSILQIKHRYITAYWSIKRSAKFIKMLIMVFCWKWYEKKPSTIFWDYIIAAFGYWSYAQVYLISNDVLCYSDTISMMHRYSCTLYRPITINYQSHKQ